jgi:hypothetical protein
MKNTKILPKIRALAREIGQIKEQQRRQGLFCHDRELLSCSRCGLEEDVTGEGFLIVAKIPSTGVDIGLRFSEVDEEKGLYRCQGCGKEVTVPDFAFP